MNALHKAIVEIAYDNGCVNRMNTEESVTDSVWSQLRTVFTEDELLQADTELGAMSAEDFEEFTIGESEEVDVSDLLASVMLEAFATL